MAKTKRMSAPTKNESSMIELPDVEPLADGIYIPEVVQKFRLTPEQGRRLKELHEALDREQARLNPHLTQRRGDRVRPDFLPDALRWLLDQLPDPM